MVMPVLVCKFTPLGFETEIIAKKQRKSKV